MSKKLETLLKFQAIFEEKSWTSMDGYDEKLDRFGELIDILRPEEINLLLDLTNRYLWMSYNDIHNNLRRLLKRLLEEKLEGKNRLIIFPIIKPKDEQELKSGHVVMKMLESIKPSINGFKHIELKLLKEYNDLLPDKLEMNEADYLILVDDYIGSGKTLSNTLAKIELNESIHDNFAILTIAIQAQAYKYLEESGITTFNSIILNKGISDNFFTPELESNTKIMRIMENKIPKVATYRFGYEKSEALITLMRTPNNTFPIFWKGMIKRGIEIDAPFQRF